MRKLIQKRLKNQKGLTLIELLVVIVILGIIAAIVVPMVMGNQSEARDAADERSVQLLQDAVNRYMVNNDNEVPVSDGNVDYTELVPDYLSSEISLQTGATISIDESTGIITYNEPE